MDTTPTLRIKKSLNAQLLVGNSKGMFQVDIVVILQQVVEVEKVWAENNRTYSIQETHQI